MYHHYDSSWRRSSRSPPRDDYHRDLLAKRMTTVEALRREMLDRWHKRMPVPAFRDIPVPLRSGETFGQYKREFEKWLLTKKETFESLRNNPSRERNFWFSFAHQRAETVSHEAGGIKKAPEAPAYSYYGPPPVERKRQMTNEPSSLQSPQTLSQKEFSIEVTGGGERSSKRQKTDESSSLESTQSSSQNESSIEVTGGDETSSKREKTDKPSPLQSTAQALAQKESSAEVAGGDGKSNSTVSEPPPFQSLSYTCYLPATREEYLAQRVVTPEEYLREVMELKQKSTPGVLDENLPKIPIPLAPGKTVETYEHSFRSWVSNRKESLESLHSDPIKERGLRCHFALERAFLTVDLQTTSLEPSCASMISLSTHETNVDAGERHISDHLSRPHSQNGNTKDLSGDNRNIEEQSRSHLTNEKSVNGSTHSSTRLSNDNQRADNSGTMSQSVSGKKQQNGDLSSLPETLPDWAKQLIARVNELERKVAQYESTSSWGSSVNDIEKISSSGDTSANKSRTFDVAEDSSSSVVPPQKTYLSATHDLTNDADGAASTNNNRLPKEDTDVRDGRDKTNNLTASVSKSTQSSIVGAKRDNRGKRTQAEAVTELLETSADIHRDGIISLAEAVQSRVQEDRRKKKLTKAYYCLNDQIVMNETAINDAAAYMKTLKGVDETMAMEQQNEIMELVVSINKEKEKRSAALAELIVQHWSGRMKILRSQLEEGPLKRRQSGVSHEKLAALLSRIDKNRNKLDEMETDVSFHLQYVRATPPRAILRALRFSGLKNLTAKLKKELAVKRKLETDQENVFTCFVKADEEVRNLVTDLLDFRRVRGVRSNMKFGVGMKRFEAW